MVWEAFPYIYLVTLMLLEPVIPSYDTRFSSDAGVGLS
jgi:hypothetical protein